MRLRAFALIWTVFLGACGGSDGASGDVDASIDADASIAETNADVASDEELLTIARECDR